MPVTILTDVFTTEDKNVKLNCILDGQCLKTSSKKKKKILYRIKEAYA